MDADFGGADTDPCEEYEGVTSGPTVGVGDRNAPSSGTLEIGVPRIVCLLEFEPGAPVKVTFVAPDGRRQSLAAPPCENRLCTSAVSWAAPLGAAPGPYAVTARQGRLVAEATLTVVPAAERRLMVEGSVWSEGVRVTVRVGATLRIALAGFDPGRLVQLLVFHTPSREQYPKDVPFLTRIPVRVDADGTAIYPLRTTTGDPLGCYVLNTWPPLPDHRGDGVWVTLDGWEQFCLVR
jgi:hypothetical protein